MKEPKLIIIPVIISAVVTVLVSWISFYSAKSQTHALLQGDLRVTRLQFQHDLGKIREQVREDVRKKALLEKQEAYKYAVECVFGMLRSKEKHTEEDVKKLQAEVNEKAARIYVFASDDVIREFSTFLLAKDKSKAFREFVLAIRTDIYGSTTLRAEEILYPVISLK